MALTVVQAFSYLDSRRCEIRWEPSTLEMTVRLEVSKPSTGLDTWVQYMGTGATFELALLDVAENVKGDMDLLGV